MRIFTLLLLGFLFIYSVPAASAEEGNTLFFKNGKTDFCIELPTQPSVVEQQGADILREYIRKVTGISMIVHRDGSRSIETQKKVHIGRTKVMMERYASSLDKLGPDGYRIITDSNAVFLFGGSRNGTVYAVTAFLEEQIGCRKFTAEEEFVPKKTTIELPVIDTTSVPAVNIRIVNGPMAADSVVKVWRRVTTISDDWRDGDWNGYYVHTFKRLVPPQKYFTSHPEYFGLINGERKEYAQLCLTNPDVLERVIDTLRQEMALHPSVKYWSVSPNDDFEYCRCSACAAVDSAEGSPCGLLLRFVNKVAEAFPEKTITTLAYSYTRKAPKITRPAKNVMITLCSIELDRKEAIEKEPGSAGFVQDLRDWHAICDNLMIWDYEVQFTNYISPFPLFHTLQPNLELFNRYGAKAHFQQCNIEHGVEFAELKLYVLSKLLWNTDIDMEAVTDDFFMHYYGAAGPYVGNYFKRMHEVEKETGQSLDIYGTPVAFARTTFDEARVKEYRNFFRRAEMMVSGQPVLLERVKIAELPLLFTEIEMAKADLFGPRGWFRRESGSFTVRPEKTALLDSFVAICNRNGISHMNENGLTVETFHESTLRFIDVSVEGNLAFEKQVTCIPDPDKRYYVNGPSTLTNGVRGAENYKTNWLGWEGIDVSCTVDLGEVKSPESAAISTLHYPKSWIIVPEKVECLVSEDGKRFEPVGVLAPDSDLTKEPLIRNFEFNLSGKKARFIRFDITGTKTLPAWHTYTGNKSWVFADEIVVR
ncbi:MAG: hypothetical protein RL021_1394 [Bacteroidota bacterium]